MKNEKKAKRGLRPVETRSKFLEEFHNLIHKCSNYYKDLDDKTIKADAFPIRNSLRELQLILSDDGNNKYLNFLSKSTIKINAFIDIAKIGDQIMHAVRLGDWSDSKSSTDEAKDWALAFRNEIYTYIQAYLMVTGVDLTKGNREMPGFHILKRTK